MTDAPKKIWVTASVAIKHWMDIPSLNRAPRIEYTRTDISQARIAELEAALSDIAQMHGDNPSIAMADMPDGDYQRYVLSHARRIARLALKAKP
jgi:hypothetical protein